jgi:hypothetical protein
MERRKSSGKYLQLEDGGSPLSVSICSNADEVLI